MPVHGKVVTIAYSAILREYKKNEYLETRRIMTHRLLHYNIDIRHKNRYLY